MKIFLYIVFVYGLFSTQSCSQSPRQPKDIQALAIERKSDLKLGVYIIAQTINELFSTEEGRREVLSVLHCNGITRIYLEAYRSGLVISPELLRSSATFLKENGFQVIGGIATVPGLNYGVQQQGPLAWLNWQSPKTQNDMRKIIEESAPIFDTFIIDDFFCTADTSLESKQAKGDRNWSEYRRALLTELAESVFIKPAKAKNPNIKLIIKYPQWYDRFHLFGYDVATEPKLFDGVWVGTETRGQYTQRFGFIQPYLGFINFRWISTLAGDKIGGAWFDHGDCTDIDFIDQAYQSVLAGSKELVFFNFDSFIAGYPGHHLLRQDFGKLADLAKAVANSPIIGPVGYKPPNSDPGGDLYLMDYIGMFGISLIPDSQYPINSKVIFLPTQAAADREIYSKIMISLDHGAKIILTSGFLANVSEGEKLAKIAGIQWPLTPLQSSTEAIETQGRIAKLKFPLRMDYQIVPSGADIMLQASIKQPFLTQKGNIYVLNTHTFSQPDFDAVGEVLLAPRQIGLLELPQEWLNTIREIFANTDEPILDAASRVTMQQLSDKSLFIQNYNQQVETVKIHFPKAQSYTDRLTGKSIPTVGKTIELSMSARSRVWVMAH